MSKAPKTKMNRGPRSPRRPLLPFAVILVLGVYLTARLCQTSKTATPTIPVQVTDALEKAGITFLGDAPATDETNYLETMGTGVGWIDYDQDGLMDLFFVDSAATDWQEPPHSLRLVL